MSCSSVRSMFVCTPESKRAALKLVGSLTWRTFTSSSGGRKAWGPLRGHADHRALRVDERGLLRQANESHVMAGEGEFHAQQRSIRRAEDQYFHGMGTKGSM